MEVRYPLRLVRHAHHHPGGDLLQHQEESGLVGQQDAREQLHRVRHARRDASERQSESPYHQVIVICSLLGNCGAIIGQHHGGVPIWRLPSSHRHRCMGQRPRCAAGEFLGRASYTVTRIILIFIYECMWQVSLVINYDLPNNRELYIHRIGRSGRFGRKGSVI